MPCKDRASQQAFQREWLRKRRCAWLADNGPCVKCGSSDRLEVDHIDQAKKLTHNIWSWSLARRKAELAKCQILCRDCHRRKSVSEIKRDPVGRFLPIQRETRA